MNYFKLNPADTVNGKGVRVSLFVSGCTHNCKGCFAKAEQNFNYGERFTDEHFSVLLSYLNKDYISGLSILGGDPLAPKNIDFIKSKCKCIKGMFPNKTIYIWTGYLFEEIDKELWENLSEEDTEELRKLEIQSEKEYEQWLKQQKLKEKRKQQEESLRKKMKEDEEKQKTQELLEQMMKAENERRQKLLEDVQNSLQGNDSTNVSSGADDIIDYEYEGELD